MLGAAEVGVIWAIGSTAGSILFFGALQLGRLLARMERVERRVEDVDERMTRAGDELSKLTGKVQTLMYPPVRRSE
jgi:hypothetical protein